MPNTDTPPRLPALLERQWRLSIGGDLRPASAAASYPIIDPSTGNAVARAPQGGKDDADAAVEAADVAWPQWRALSVFQRGEYLKRLAEAVVARAEDFAALDALCGGGPITEMRKDVASAVRNLLYFAGIGPALTGDTIPASQHLHLTERVPFGVVVRIVAFNHPFMFSAAKAAAPLMAGNTVIIKPPQSAPLSALLLAEIAAGIFPPGVFSVVVGDGPEVPRALVAHPKVRRIGFVGSGPTGRAIQRDAAAAGVKTVTLELGGKNALIVFDDADVESAAQAAVRGMNFAWAGQSCGSTSRLLVHESVADRVLERILGLIREVRIGPASEEATQMGPLASRLQLDRVVGDIAEALDDGARLLAGGKRPAGLDGGFFLEPTVLEVSPGMRIARKEVFGPVLSVLRWNDEQQMIATANAPEYGLTGAIFTRDITRALRTARLLEAGFIWINGVSQHFTGVPYGGVKASGIGRDEAFEELESYTQSKAINIFL
jgi:acyl-CoA reductase-like NAD-dependent aldehyde dehydrogenase